MVRFEVLLSRYIYFLILLVTIEQKNYFRTRMQIEL